MPARDRTSSSGLPSELENAINQAATRYGVPASTLVGIWRIESGSSFPNPYVNSIGYGGLFGTHNWNASTQDQANTSAQILANLLRQYNGDMSQALYHYSGGGYTSVPGGPVGTVNTSAAGGSRGSRPSGGGGFVHELGSIAGWAGKVGEGTLLGGPLAGVWGGLFGSGNPITAAVDFLKAALWLVNPINWLRAVETAAGFVLMLTGIYFLATAADGASPASKATSLVRLPGVGAAAGGLQGVVKTSQKGKQARRQRTRKREDDSDRQERREVDQIIRGHRESQAEHKAKGAKARAEIERARATREKRKTRAGKPSERKRRAAAQTRAERRAGVDIFGAPLSAAEKAAIVVPK